MITPSINKWLPIVISLCIAAAVFQTVSNATQSTVYRVLLTAFFTSNSDVIVSSVDENGKVDWSSSFEVKSEKPRREMTVGTPILNKPLGRLRIEIINKDERDRPSGKKRKVVLLNIQVPMSLSQDYYFGTLQIRESFKTDQADPDDVGSYFFDPESHKISLERADAIGKNNLFTSVGISLLFGIACWLIFRNSNWSEIPAFKDMGLGNKISSSAEFDAINGIRGLAALLVVLSHTAPWFTSIQFGLTLLFVISGFLLTKPFVFDNEKIFSWSNIERYLTKRIKRILPMYYFFIFISYVLTTQFESALRHFLFIQAQGHLWPMTQIFTFYMMLPLILVITSLLYRVNRWLPIIVLLIASRIWQTELSDWMPYFNGEFYHAFFLHTFLLGVASAYVYYDIIAKSDLIGKFLDKFGSVLAIGALLFIFFSLAWAAPLKPPAAVLPYISQFHIKSILSAVIVLLILMTSTSWLRFLTANWLFRSVGVVGFSFYLLHGLSISLLNRFNKHILHVPEFQIGTWGFFLATFLLTYLMAIITYSYVERPFFGYRQKPNPK